MPKENLDGNIARLDGLQSEYADIVKKDTEFKSLFKYKSVASMLLKYAVPDFEKYTLQQIADAIVDIRSREPVNDSERYHSEIDLMNVESGDGGEKLIRMDNVFAVYFEIKPPDSDKSIYVNFSVDFEMQGVKPKEYKLVTRGIYYGASLLRDTLKTTEKYENIHKVIVVWLCNFELLDTPTHRDRYVHNYNFFRNYQENGGIIYEKDPDADMIEVIFIELKKLSEHIQDDELAQFLDAVFNNIGSLPKLLEENLGAPLSGTALSEGVNEVINITKYGEVMEAKGAHKKAIETVKNLIEMGILTLQQIAQSVKMSVEDIEKIKNEMQEQK
jgi:hypothetical protein